MVIIWHLYFWCQSLYPCQVQQNIGKLWFLFIFEPCPEGGVWWFKKCSYLVEPLNLLVTSLLFIWLIGQARIKRGVKRGWGLAGGSAPFIPSGVIMLLAMGQVLEEWRMKCFWPSVDDLDQGCSCFVNELTVIGICMFWLVKLMFVCCLNHLKVGQELEGIWSWHNNWLCQLTEDGFIL